MVLQDFAFRLKRKARNGLHDFQRKRGLSGLRGINLRFLFTCRTGIFLFDCGKVTELVRGPHFGLTTAAKGSVIAAEWIGDRAIQKTVVFRYEFDGRTLSKGDRIIFRDQDGRELHPFGIHQIRVLNGFLWVVNTRENVVWKCTLDGLVVSEWTEEGKMIFEEDNFEDCNVFRKSTEEYRHYNSITYHDGHYYILAHNCTQHENKPSKRSYVVKLNEELEVVGRIEGVGRACHDVWFSDKKMYVCNSLEGKIMEDGRPIMDLGAFLRGLGKIGSILITGGSPHELTRSARDSSFSRLFLVDLPAKRLLYTLELGNLGNILDILCLEDDPIV